MPNGGDNAGANMLGSWVKLTEMSKLSGIIETELAKNPVHSYLDREECEGGRIRLDRYMRPDGRTYLEFESRYRQDDESRKQSF